MHRLQLFDHLARRPNKEDHHSVMVAAMSNPATGWRRPRGRPRETLLRTVSRGIQSFNISIDSAWHRAADHQQWHELIDTAMLQLQSMKRRKISNAVRSAI